MKGYPHLTVLILIFTLSACQQHEGHHSDTPTQQEPQEIVGCTPDLKTCADGTQVERNPNLNCAFDPCKGAKPEDSVMLCTMDVKECPGGIYVSRDPKNNCAFPDCPPPPDS